MKNISVTLKRLFILLPMSFAIICNLCNAQSPLQIQWVGGANDVCFSCITLEVVNPQVGYTYEWIRADYSCQPMGNATIVGTGSQILACLTGEYRCGSTSPTGVIELSDPLRVRTLGSYLLPAPYYANTVNCASGVTLCIPWIFLTSFTSNTVITWYKNNVVINAATANYINATSSGYYKYSITTNCIIAYSDSVHLTTLPAASISASGPTTFCSGGSVTLNASVAANRSYQWQKNGAIIGGAVQSSYTATTSGTYKVTVTNTNTGCSKTTGTGTTVTVNSNPTVSVTPQGPTTFCLGDSVQLKASYKSTWLYQWKKNNTNINGATSNKIYAKTAGTYKVKVTNANGCTTISSPVQISVPCRGEQPAADIDNKLNVNVFPNPGTNRFTFRFYLNEELEKTVYLCDITGRIVKFANTREQTMILSTTDLLPGVYTAVVKNSSAFVKIPLIILAERD